MLEVNHAARAARHAVVRQPEQIERAPVTRVQVAVLQVQPQTPARGHQRRDGGVLIRCDVPVVGQRQLETALAVEVEARWQEPGLAGVAQREAQIGGGQDGHPLEPDHRVAGGALVGLHVHVDAAGLERPVGFSRLAFGGVGRCAAAVGGAGGAQTLFAQELDQFGTATRLGAGEPEARTHEFAFQTVQLQRQFGADENVALTHHAHLAHGSGGVVTLGVGQFVGLQGQVPLSQAHLAGGAGALASLAFQVVGLEVHRLLALFAAGDDAGQRERQTAGGATGRCRRSLCGRCSLCQQVGGRGVDSLCVGRGQQGKVHQSQSGRHSGRGPAGGQGAEAPRGAGQGRVHGHDGASLKGRRRGLRGRVLALPKIGALFHVPLFSDRSLSPP